MLIYLDNYELHDIYEALRAQNVKYKRYQQLLSKFEEELRYYEED